MSQPATTREYELAVAAVADLQRRERGTAKSLLLAETFTLRRLQASVRRANDALVAAVVPVGREHAASVAASVVRQESQALQVAIYADLSAANLAARQAGRERLVATLGTSVVVMADGGAGHAISSASAAASGASLTSSWMSAALGAIGAWRGRGSLARELSSVPTSVAPRVIRVAATETARSFNDERTRYLDAVIGGPYRGSVDGARGFVDRDQPPRAGVWKIWSAVLDRRTCPRCFDLDGTILEGAGVFPAGPPPVHPHCRCLVEYIIVPKPERLEDIAIDYDLFKQEVRDIIRERREVEDGRYSFEFAAESMGRKRSPLVLSDRFRKRPYER